MISGLPEVRWYIGFNSPTTGNVFTVGHPTLGQVGVVPIGAEDTWVDVTQWVRSWVIKRGAGTGDSPTLRYDAGTAVVELNDSDRRFDPENLAGPYVSAGRSQVEPMRRVKCVATWDGVTYPLFYGLSDNFEANYNGNFWTTTTLTATDPSKVLAALDRDAVAPVGAGEDSGARVTRILDAAAWSSTARVILTGDTTLQATDLAGNTLGELQLVQDTERGEFYFDAQGRAVFRNRHAMLTATRSATSQATFGDGGYTQPVAWTFESGVGAFSATGASIAASTAQAHYGTQSLLMTVVGTPGQAYARQIYGSPVTVGRSYTATFWVYYPAGGSVGAAIDWANSGGYLSTSFSSTVVAAATWTQLTVTGTAPATATLASFGPTLASPGAGVQLYLDQMLLTDNSNELPYADAKPSSPDEALVNSVTAARAGGTEQLVEDALSIGRYLKKTHTRNDLLSETDSEALNWAKSILYQHKDPARRFARLEFGRPRVGLEDVMWPALLGREFGDRITVKRRPKGGGDPIVRDCFVRGLEYSSNGAVFSTAFVLQSADRYSFFVVGDPILGRVGLNAVAY